MRTKAQKIARVIPNRSSTREVDDRAGWWPPQRWLISACMYWTLFPTPWYRDEEMNIFRVTGLRTPGMDDGPAQPDDDEDIEARAFTLDAVRQIVGTGEIID